MTDIATMAQPSCPVCGGDRAARVFTDRNRREGLAVTGTYVRCRECDLIYLVPAPTRAELAKMYEELFVEQIDLSQSQTAIRSDEASLLQRISRRLRSRPHSWPLEEGLGRRLLDVGCGDASKLIEFAQRGWEVWGIDVSRSAIEHAQRNIAAGKFVVGELPSSDLPAHAFDVVRLDNVLEHVPDPDRLLDECRALLRPDVGRVHIYVPHGRSLSMRLLRRYSITSWIPFHILLFTGRSLERLLVARGFGDVRMSQFSPPDWWPESLKQFIGIHPQKRLNRWIEGVLLALTLPVGTLAAHLGCGEELVAVARPAPGSGSG